MCKRILALLCFLSTLSAQETIQFSSISGRVIDPTRAVVEAAEVQARHLDTNLTSTASTDREGRFRFPYLKLGAYEIKIHRDGFSPVTRKLTLTVDPPSSFPSLWPSPRRNRTSPSRATRKSSKPLAARSPEP